MLNITLNGIEITNSFNMSQTSQRHCKNGEHEYRAGFCINCFKINVKLNEREQAECIALRNKLDERARKEREKQPVENFLTV